MHIHRFWGPFTFDSKAFASKWVSNSNIPDCVWRDNISTSLLILKTIPNFVSLFSLGPHTIGWMQLLGQEDQGNLGEVGRCQNPGLAYFYISPCIYICICEIGIFFRNLYLYLYLYFRQFVFVLVIVTRTRKSARVGSLSKSWISCSSLASLESLAHTSSDLGDSLTIYGLDILTHG